MAADEKGMGKAESSNQDEGVEAMHVDKSHVVFSTRLKALCYPRYLSFDIQSFSERRSLVYWLENQHIRVYSIDQRAVLLNFDDEWPLHFNQYLKDVGCPFSVLESSFEWKSDCTSRSVLRVYGWLLSRALQLSYQDLAPHYDPYASKTKDFLSESKVQKSIAELATVLQIPSQTEKTHLLQTLSRTIIRDYQDMVLVEARKMGGKDVSLRSELRDFPAGFETGDSLIDRAIVVLRMLYVADLQQLQGEINELIAFAQNFTANPQTNASLGKVGR